MNWRRMKRVPAFLLIVVSVTSLCLGCAPEAGAVKPEDVVLIEPVGVEEGYETVVRRNLYDSKVYDGIICPYAEEQSLEKDIYFNECATLPGEWVKKGQTIISADTEQLDKQIEDMRKRMAEDEESYQEYMKENEESLAKLREEEKSWGEVVERWEKEKPEEYLPAGNTGTDIETGTETEAGTDEDSASAPQPNPDYAKWAGDMSFYEAKYRNAMIGKEKLEAAIEQRRELYQLDLEYQQLLLKRLETQRAESNVLAEMQGYVANVRVESKGTHIWSNNPMAAVVDPDRKLLKTDFVNNQEISAAEQVFAVVDGKRYEVEHEPMDSAEYKRLMEDNGKVYSTFYLPEELEDAELGTYVAVVVIRKSRQNALTVSKKAVATGEDGSYVYVLRDGERIYTPIKTGLQDGVYVEILSGLEEGDRVLSEEAQPKAGKTQTLVMGSVSHEVSKKASLTYFQQDVISNSIKHGNVYFEECYVTYYQQVKKGEVLMKIRVEPDGAELTRLEKTLLREQERMADLRRQDEEKNAKQIKAKEKTIAELEKQIAEIKADYATTEIRAPYDGTIIYMDYYLYDHSIKAGDLISPGYRFMTLSPVDSNYLIVEDEDGLLSFGNRAVVEYGNQGAVRKTAEGQVVSLNLRSVSADMLMRDESEVRWNGSMESKVSTLIRMSSESMEDFVGSYFNDGGWWSESSYRVTVTTRKMDNVLLVPKRAVLNYGGTTYAKVMLEDGTVMYQGFVAGGADSENYWVVEGLTEGMEVCIE